MFDVAARTISEPVPGTPPFNAHRSTTSEQGIEVVNPIPTTSAGLDLEIHSKVLGVYDTRGSMISEQEHELVDIKTGTVYTKMTSSTSGIGQGGYGGPQGPIKSVIETPARQPDVVHTYKTTSEAALLYRLCGDYDPMHADDGLGRRVGFRGATLQGLCTWNIAAHGLLRGVADSDPTRFKAFGARFTSAVYPGDELETWIWKIGSDGRFDNYVFETIVKNNGRVVLSDGYAKMKQQGSKL